MKKKNRKHSIIDGLPADLKDAVDEMIKANFTYSEIVDYIRKNGVEISMSSVQRYASNLNETLKNLRLAQENFRAIMEETEKYKELDATDGMLQILGNHVFKAINSISEYEENPDIDKLERLIKNTATLARVVAYKKKIDIDSKNILENGADKFMSDIFEVMADEKPELYKEIKKFVKSKKE